ncbi:unnamed protein product [Musa hybrid cultivar]
MGRGGRVVYKRAAAGRRRRRRSKASDDDDDDDDEEYVLGEEEEEESSDEPLASDGEEDEYEFGESTGGSDDDDEQEFLAPRSKPRKAPSKPKRRVKKSRVWDDDDDDDYEEEEEEDEEDEEEEEDRVDFSIRKKGERRKKAGVRSRRQKPRASDSEEEAREEEDDDGDEDFSPDEQDFEDEEASAISEFKRKGGNPKQGGKKRKPRALKRKKGKRSRPHRSGEDDDFIVKDRVAIDRKSKKPKETGRRKVSTSWAIKNKSPVESDTSNFDFVTSDDDFMEDTVLLNRPEINNKHFRKTNTKRTRRKVMVSSDKSESSLDGDYMISEEELRDLGVGGVLDQPQLKRISAGMKGDKKGKEKENDELGKPLCGICLSEEQRMTVRGVLNCCTHYFCFACIMEWSKVESRCPVCKRRFGTITKSSRSDPGFGLRKAVIKVEKRDQVYQPSEEEIRRMMDPYENVVCIECHQGGDDSLMLLCDICDSPAHTYCVGLGREVPEGNWYCECCRSAGDGSSYLQNERIVTDQAANSSDFLVTPVRMEDVAVRDNTNLQRSSQPSLQEIDLNVSPRSVEDYGSTSQFFGAGATTLSGRRAIHQRIRILLSNSRPRQISAETNVLRDNMASGVMTSEVRESGESLHSSQGFSSWNRGSAAEQCHHNNRPSVQSNANLVQCATESSSFQHVNGAKEQVHSMVKSHLKELSSGSPLDRITFKEFARRSTHTVLAACGIKHHRRMVSVPVHPPGCCSHVSDQEQVVVTQGCCLSCFSSYVKDVVQKILHAT